MCGNRRRTKRITYEGIPVWVQFRPGDRCHGAHLRSWVEYTLGTDGIFRPERGDESDVGVVIAIREGGRTRACPPDMLHKVYARSELLRVEGLIEGARQAGYPIASEEEEDARDRQLDDELRD